MFDLLARIFTTPKAVDKTLDAVVAAGDKIWFTEEEKSEHQIIMSEWYLKYLEATQPQALSRRLLAFFIGFMWVVLVLLGTALGVLGDGGNDAKAEYVFNILNDVVNSPFTAVVIFYFGGHYLKEVLDKRQRS